MIIILAKHDGCSREFVWTVPPWMDVHKGDVLLVDTMHGLDVATASSEPIVSDDAGEIAVRLGAYLPLKEVKGFCGQTLMLYIRNKTLDEASQMIDNMKINLIRPRDFPF